jgi:16S rRNA (cytosine1402-N4)-methyltransferase
MRMDQSNPFTAADLINSITEAHLTQILREFGEEPKSRQFARAIIAGRPWTSTVALAECIRKASGDLKRSG